ncbi:MAG: glycerol-3-phosphate dehydrogenase [Candidatus Omnitrophica bacterium]|nr:glycerol-3-phosphate dehydrogenase [Candidatus Omnitrophota bacterium]
MKRNIGQFKKSPYDLLVVGGGINGSAVANLAAQNGLRTALLEKNDFASGASSKSTKLIHGGLRYLENFEFGLVKESLRERTAQLRSAPHLVKPLAFIIPVYKNDRRPLWMMKLGVSIYDLLSGKHIIHPYKPLSVEEVLHFIPSVEKKNLTGGLIYWDAQMDDARLVLENVLQADKSGAHVANYVEVKSIIKENGKAVGVKARDLLTNETFDVRCRKIVCAAGPWTNLFQQKEMNKAPDKIRTTKGIHIVYNARFSPHAVFIQSKKDDRIFFVIPWHGHTLIGTTDSDYTDNPDDVSVKPEDIDYLFKEASRVFPEEKFTDEKIITTFAGLRPLVNAADGSPGKISRRHVIEDSFSGIQYIYGGKYTTYRVIAQQSVQKILKKKILFSDDISLYGGGKLNKSPMELCEQYGIEPSMIESLIQTYGSRAEDVLILTTKDPILKERIHLSSTMIKAQIRYSVDVEMAIKEDDILIRRLPISYTGAINHAVRRYINSLLVQ